MWEMSIFTLYFLVIIIITATTLKVVFINFLVLDCVYYFPYCICHLLLTVTIYDKYYCAIWIHSILSNIRLP